MTLADLATFICTTVNQNEAVDVAACKSYLTQRHKLLWQSALWKNSFVEYRQTITSQGYDPTMSTWLPTRQILLVAPIIAQVVAIRTDDRMMAVKSSEWFYCADVDAFQNKGTAVNYRLLSPAVWDYDTVQALLVACTNAGDANSPMQFSFLATDGITEIQLSQNLTTMSQLLGSFLTIEDASKTVTQGPISLGTAASSFTVNIGFSSDLVGTHFAVGINTTDVTQRQLDLTSGQSGAVTVKVGDVINFFFSFGGDGNYAYYSTNYTVTAAGTLSVTDSTNGFGNPGTSSFVASGSGGIADVAGMSATTTSAIKRERVQLVGSVTDNTVLRILGKRTCPRFELDSDTPAIPGSENALICAAHADMLKRERQYGKAATMMTQELPPLLAALMGEQTAQQAFKKRFVPTDGFGGFDSFVGHDNSFLF